jgi:hypothetical protein
MTDETEETVTITIKEYNELLDDRAFLDSLRIAGVDNWQGWDDACDIYNGVND